jgi:hypothetical protein
MASRAQVEMRAEFLNDVASGGVVAAVIAPIFGLLLANDAVDWVAIGGLFALALVLSLIIHDIACRVAEKLE